MPTPFPTPYQLKTDKKARFVSPELKQGPIFPVVGLPQFKPMYTQAAPLVDPRAVINVFYRTFYRVGTKNIIEVPPNLPPSWSYITKSPTATPTYGYNVRVIFKGDHADQQTALDALVNWYDQYTAHGTIRYYGISLTEEEPVPSMIATVEPTLRPVPQPEEPEIMVASLHVLYSPIDQNFMEGPPELPGDWEWIGSGGSPNRRYSIEVQFSGHPNYTEQARYALNQWYNNLVRQRHVRNFEVVDFV
jgi:hypothetical protein